ncbi:MAG: RidA family protein [Alphaproteobacteria bacterium]
MNSYINPAVLHVPAGAYSHIVQAPAGARWTVLSGQIGLRPDGSVPESFEAQAEQTYANIKTALGLVGLGLKDVVKLTTYLTDASFIEPFFRVRARVLGEHRPASTLLLVAGLMKPNWYIEIDCMAAQS